MFGRFSPFRDRSSPPTRDDARHVVASDGHHFQLNEAVIEREQIPRLHSLRQAREADGDALLVANHLDLS